MVILFFIRSRFRADETVIRPLYDALMKQLSEDHSEIRLSAFQVMIEIFERSHSFRNIVIDSLQELFVLILETEPSRGLPPPNEAKKRLKSLSISTIESWVKTYGDTYRSVISCSLIE